MTDRRTTLIMAATELVAEFGADNLTHRMVAERADVPLGSTTYYFDSIDELVHEALDSIAGNTQRDLDDMEQRLDGEPNLVETLSQVIWEYLQNSTSLTYWNELYSSANHRPEVSNLAMLWSNGLVRILKKHMPPDAAQATAMFIDGILLRVNVANDLPSFNLIRRSIAHIGKLDQSDETS